MQLHLIGDSVFQGGVTDIRDNPSRSLDDLRTPARIINLVMGREFSRFSAHTCIPKDPERGETEILTAFSAGVIRDGDVLATLDVGPHAMDTARHERDWLRIRRAATGRRKVLLIMCSGFDNGAQGARDQQHEALLDHRSPNDAVQAAAEAPGEFAGRTVHLDIARPLKELDHRLRHGFGVSAYYRDGVHLTAWGQICLCLLLLRQLAARPRRPHHLVRATRRNHVELGLRAPADAAAAFATVAAVAGYPAAWTDLATWRALVEEAWDGRLTRRLKTPPTPPVSRSPKSAALVLEADRLFIAERFRDALAAYRDASLQDPACLHAHRGWIKSAVRAGNTAEILDAGRRILPLEPWEAKYYVWIAQTLVQNGATAKDLDWLDAFAEAHAPPSAFLTMARLSAATGDEVRERKWSEWALANQ